MYRTTAATTEESVLNDNRLSIVVLLDVVDRLLTKHQQRDFLPDSDEQAKSHNAQECKQPSTTVSANDVQLSRETVSHDGGMEFDKKEEADRSYEYVLC